MHAGRIGRSEGKPHGSGVAGGVGSGVMPANFGGFIRFAGQPQSRFLASQWGLLLIRYLRVCFAELVRRRSKASITARFDAIPSTNGTLKKANCHEQTSNKRSVFPTLGFDAGAGPGAAMPNQCGGGRRQWRWQEPLRFLARVQWPPERPGSSNSRATITCVPRELQPHWVRESKQCFPLGPSARQLGWTHV